MYCTPLNRLIISSIILPNYHTLEDVAKAFPKEQDCLDHINSLRRIDNCQNDDEILDETIFEHCSTDLRTGFGAIWLVMENTEDPDPWELEEKLGICKAYAHTLLTRINEVIMHPMDAPDNRSKSKIGKEEAKYWVDSYRKFLDVKYDISLDPDQHID